MDSSFGLVLPDKGQQFLNLPNAVDQSGFHRWRDSQGLVNACKIVVFIFETPTRCF